jgi:pyruvate dehydrogenase E1 component beta subunit
MSGAGWGVGAQHNHNLEAMFVHAPGLKVVMPSDVTDTKGLLQAAIRDDNPVLFFHDIAAAHVPAEMRDDSPVPALGTAARRRTGADVTLVSYGKTVGHCLVAAQNLSQRGIEAEVLDLRSLKPLDEAAVLASARGTGRVVVVHEANRMCGVGAEVAALVAERAFRALRAPVTRLGGPDAPSAGSWGLEQVGVPQADAIADAAARLLDETLTPLAS